jgi:hypothetical protein
MTPEKFESCLERFQQISVETLKEKSKEYSYNNDRFWNFKEIAKIEGINPAKALTGLAAKQIVCIKQIVSNWDDEKAAYSKEFIDEKLKDTVNYYILLWGMAYERFGYDSEIPEFLLKIGQNGASETPEILKTDGLQAEIKKETKTWTESQEKYLIDHFATTKIKEIAETLKRSERSIENKARRLELKKNPPLNPIQIRDGFSRK